MLTSLSWPLARRTLASPNKAQPGAQLQAEINALIARVESVLRTQLVSEKPDNDPERSTHLASRSPHVDHRAGVSHATQPDEERAG
jgi:hypothetical protein